MRFMSRLRESFARFMVGRYGPDQFYNFLLGVYLVLLVLNLFFNSLALMLLETALFVYMFFRVFSRNIYNRQEENRWYLKVSKKPKDFFALMKNRIRDRKTHVYRTCPACKSNLRLPKQRGKHTAVCPRCARRFDVNI